MVLNKHNHITGSRLRDARILANKTAKEVAAQIGVSAQALSLYEHECRKLQATVNNIWIAYKFLL